MLVYLLALMSWKRTSKTQSCATFPRGRKFTWNGMGDILIEPADFRLEWNYKEYGLDAPTPPHEIRKEAKHEDSSPAIRSPTRTRNMCGKPTEGAPSHGSPR